MESSNDAPTGGGSSLPQPAQTLLEREAGLRAILESAVDAIVTMDERGAIQSFQPRRGEALRISAG